MSASGMNPTRAAGNLCSVVAALGTVFVQPGHRVEAGVQVAPAQDLAFDQQEWQIEGDAKVETFLGETALRMRNAEASLPALELLDGTIDFDVALTGDRAFLGIRFRVVSDRAREEIYLRGHKSGSPDALQYTPAFQGVGNWQIYHGEGYTAAAAFAHDEWVHVRLVVEGTRAAVFVGEAESPQLIVPQLARGPRSGTIELWSNFPSAGLTDSYPVAVANLRIRGDTNYRFPPSRTPTRSLGILGRWAMSELFLVDNDEPVTRLPEVIVDGNWDSTAVDASGVLLFDRHRARLQQDGRHGVLARLLLRSSSAQIKRLDRGFSDDVSVFLNNQLIYSARNGYSFNFPRRQGLITLDQASLYLQLNAGDNALVVAVTETFGGWGLIGRIDDRDGLGILPIGPLSRGRD